MIQNVMTDFNLLKCGEFLNLDKDPCNKYNISATHG